MEYINNTERVFTRLVNNYSDKEGLDGGGYAVNFWERAHTMRIYLRGKPEEAVYMARNTLLNNDRLQVSSPALWQVYRLMCQADYIMRNLPEAVHTARDDEHSLNFWATAYEVARV